MSSPTRIHLSVDRKPLVDLMDVVTEFEGGGIRFVHVSGVPESFHGRVSRRRRRRRAEVPRHRKHRVLFVYKSEEFKGLRGSS